ncbi:hypothetical protein ABTM81_20670, partial [Acinetobacter baumannii]
GYFFAGAAVYGAALKGWLRLPVLVLGGLALVAAAWYLSHHTRHWLEPATLAGTFGMPFLTLAIDLADRNDVLRAGRQ